MIQLRFTGIYPSNSLMARLARLAKGGVSIGTPGGASSGAGAKAKNFSNAAKPWLLPMGSNDAQLVCARMFLFVRSGCMIECCCRLIGKPDECHQSKKLTRVLAESSG